VYKPTPPDKRSDVGAACELIVAADLLRRGFAVYRNVSQAGITDLVALKNGRVLRVQVKHHNGGNRHERALNDVIATCPGAVFYLVTNPAWTDEFKDAARKQRVKMWRQPASADLDSFREHAA
jgi:hypothetical protein